MSSSAPFHCLLCSSHSCANAIRPGALSSPPSPFLCAQRCWGSPTWDRGLETWPARGRVPLCPAPVSLTPCSEDNGWGCSWNADVPSATAAARAGLHPSALLWVPPPGGGGHLCPVGCGAEPSSLLSQRKHLCLWLGGKNHPTPGPPKLEE